MTLCDDVAVDPWDAVKASEVDVVTCRIAGFTTFTTMDADDVLFDVSSARAIRVDEPSCTEVVFHEMEY